MKNKNLWVVEKKRENVYVLMYGTGENFLDIFSIDNKMCIEFTCVFKPDELSSRRKYFIEKCVSLQDVTLVEQYNPKCAQIRFMAIHDAEKLSSYIDTMTHYFPEVQQMKYALLSLADFNTKKKLVDKYGNWDLLREIPYCAEKTQYKHKQISIEISPISKNSCMVAFSFTPDSFERIKPSFISSNLVNEENPKYSFRCETDEIRENVRVCIEEIDKHYPLHDMKYEIFKRCDIEVNYANNEASLESSDETATIQSIIKKYKMFKQCGIEVNYANNEASLESSDETVVLQSIPKRHSL